MLNRECAKIIEKKQWESEQSRVHFQSGVRLGIATFNVMISLLPPKIISLLEFVGFSGNKVTYTTSSSTARSPLLNAGISLGKRSWLNIWLVY